MFMKSVLLSITALRNLLICLSGLLWKQLVIYLLKEEKRGLVFSPAIRATIEQIYTAEIFDVPY